MHITLLWGQEDFFFNEIRASRTIFMSVLPFKWVPGWDLGSELCCICLLTWNIELDLKWSKTRAQKTYTCFKWRIYYSGVNKACVLHVRAHTHTAPHSLWGWARKLPSFCPLLGSRHAGLRGSKNPLRNLELRPEIKMLFLGAFSKKTIKPLPVKLPWEFLKCGPQKSSITPGLGRNKSRAAPQTCWMGIWGAGPGDLCCPEPPMSCSLKLVNHWTMPSSPLPYSCSVLINVPTREERAAEFPCEPLDLTDS